MSEDSTNGYRDEGPDGRPLPLSVRLLGAGVRGVREVGKATGVDRAVQVAAEEAMVAAVESEAVERALVRVLKGPVVEEAVNGALESDAVKRALIDALDSELVDEVWLRLLASDETQRLVERIAEAPEIRAAISAQSVGFIEDIGHTIGDATRNIDTVLERIVRRIFFRPQRTEPTDRAGALTRALAFGLDVLIVNLGFSGLAAIAALVVSAFTGGNGVSEIALVFGTTAWLVLGGSLPGRVLVARRPDARHAIPRDQARGRGPGLAGAQIDPPPGWPRARGADLRHRLSSGSSSTPAGAAGRTGWPASTCSTSRARQRPGRSRRWARTPSGPRTRRRPRIPGAFGHSVLPVPD